MTLLRCINPFRGPVLALVVPSDRFLSSSLPSCFRRSGTTTIGLELRESVILRPGSSSPSSPSCFVLHRPPEFRLVSAFTLLLSSSSVSSVPECQCLAASFDRASFSDRAPRHLLYIT